MVRRPDLPQRRERPLNSGAAARARAACRHGLAVFGMFVVVAVFFFLVTFAPYKTVNGMKDLPLPMWIMLSPTLGLLGAGVITGLIVMVVDLIRARRPH